jgi:hypothetical protein
MVFDYFYHLQEFALTNEKAMVGWRTSSIRRPNELPKPNLLATDPNYPHIVYVERGNVDNGSCQSTSTVVTEQDTDLEGFALFLT